MLVVTTNDIPGWEIQRVCGEVFGLTVRSRNAFSQMGASFKSMFGGELQGMTKNLAESRNEAMNRLMSEASNRGGNAIIGMRFDTTELGEVWTEICAYGTAVQAVPVTEGARYTASQLGYGGAPQPQNQPQHQPQQQLPYGAEVGACSRGRVNRRGGGRRHRGLPLTTAAPGAGSMWINPHDIPGDSVYHWPNLAASAHQATSPMFAFEQACGSTPESWRANIGEGGSAAQIARFGDDYDATTWHGQQIIFAAPGAGDESVNKRPRFLQLALQRDGHLLEHAQRWATDIDHLARRRRGKYATRQRQGNGCGLPALPHRRAARLPGAVVLQQFGRGLGAGFVGRPTGAVVVGPFRRGSARGDQFGAVRPGHRSVRPTISATDKLSVGALIESTECCGKTT